MKRNINIAKGNSFRPLTLFLFFLLLHVPAHAQNEQLLYSGMMEKGYPSRLFANTPYYPQDFQKGKVTYHGFTYENVSLKADLATGQLIILSPTTDYSLTYEPQDLDGVELDSRQLIYLEKPFVGWYHEIAQGKDWILYTRLYISNQNREIKESAMVTRFTFGQKLYLCKQNEWTSVSGLSAFCKQFREHHKEIESFAKKHKLKLNAQDIQGWKLICDFVNANF